MAQCGFILRPFQNGLFIRAPLMEQHQRGQCAQGKLAGQRLQLGVVHVDFGQGHRRIGRADQRFHLRGHGLALRHLGGVEIDDDRLFHGRIEQFCVEVLGSDVDDHEADSRKMVWINMGSSGVEFKRASSRWASTRRVGAARLSHPLPVGQSRIS